MKTRIAAIAVTTMLTLSVIAFGVSALGEAQGATAATSNVVVEDTGLGSGDIAAVSAFKYVRPFH